VGADRTAEIVEMPEAMDGSSILPADSGEHPDWEDYRAAMERDKGLAAHQRARLPDGG
jgi:hypothetical protein